MRGDGARDERLERCLVVALAELILIVGERAGCRYLGLSRATVQRHAHPVTRPPRAPRKAPDWSLSQPEREAFLTLAHSVEFIDKSCAEIFYTMLDQGTFLMSVKPFGQDWLPSKV
jgi:hypothetical protein